MTSILDFTAKFADDAKIGNSVISDREWVNLQKDLRKISASYARWEMPFNVKKCHILQVGTRNLKYDYEVRGVKLESVQCVKDQILVLGQRRILNFPSNVKDAAGKANRMLGFIKKIFSQE